MDKLSKYLIFCQLHYVTDHQRPCRYCGIIQSAPDASVSLLNWIWVGSTQDLLWDENWRGRAASSHPAGWWSPEQLLNQYLSTTSAPLTSLRAAGLMQNMSSSGLQPGKLEQEGAGHERGWRCHTRSCTVEPQKLWGIRHSAESGSDAFESAKRGGEQGKEAAPWCSFG